MPHPDIFLIGAPKCATSSLFDWLAQHPSVVGSDPKETYYILDAHHPHASGEWEKRGDEGWLDFFPAEKPEGTRWLEGTVQGIYSKRTRELIGERYDDADVIVVLRDPADRIYSFYQYCVENVVAFKKPLAFDDFVDILLEDRVDVLDEYVHRPSSLFAFKRDLSYSDYVDWMRKWRVAVGDRLQIYTMNDIRRDPAGTLATVVERCGLEPWDAPPETFEKKNTTYAARSEGLNRLARTVGNKLGDFPGREVVAKAYRKVATRKPDKSERPDEAIAKLRAHFEPSVAALRAEFGVEL